MNSLSQRNKWPWKDRNGGEGSPERQTTREARSRARRRAMGRPLALIAAMALGTWLTWVPSSSAFHDSALDPQSKEALAGLLQALRDECRAGDREACEGARQVQAFGNQLAQVQQACARGDQRACQVAAQAQQQLGALLEQVEGMDNPSPMPPKPTFRPPQMRQERWSGESRPPASTRGPRESESESEWYRRKEECVREIHQRASNDPGGTGWVSRSRERQREIEACYRN
jgi:hypothetical protein